MACTQAVNFADLEVPQTTWLEHFDRLVVREALLKIPVTCRTGCEDDHLRLEDIKLRS